MKLTTLGIALGLSLLVGCSSQSRRITASDETTRDAYITETQKRLDQWQNRIGYLRVDRQTAPRAALNDARAELGSLRAAPPTSWSQYRPRVDSRIDHIQNVYDSMKAE